MNQARSPYRKIINGAAFDGDGILYDTETFQYLAWRDTVKELSGKDMTKENYIKNYCGNSSIENAKNIANDYNIVFDSMEMLKLREDYVLKHLKQGKVEKMPFAEQMLGYISTNVPTAITTGSGLDETMYKLEQTGLDKIVNKNNIELVTSEDVEKGKPAPDTYNIAADKLIVKPENMIAFEDTKAGYESAKNAGTNVYVIPTEWSKSRIPKIQIFQDLNDALKHIQNNYKLKSNC